MASLQTRPMTQDKFLLVAVNLLHRAFVDCIRAEAKRRFRKVEKGETLLLSNVEMEDGSTARFALSLDCSEYRGRLNFSGFRASLEVLVANLAQALREERELPVFNAQEPDSQGPGSQDNRQKVAGSSIFGVTGPTMTGGRANVMVLAAEPDAGSDVTVLQLMYLDPAQFEPQ